MHTNPNAKQAVFLCEFNFKLSGKNACVRAYVYYITACASKIKNTALPKLHKRNCCMLKYIHVNILLTLYIINILAYYNVCMLI